MDNEVFIADCRTRLAEDIRELKLAELIRQSYEQHIGREPRERDWEAIDKKRREAYQVSDRAHNCPRGEFR